MTALLNDWLFEHPLLLSLLLAAAGAIALWRSLTGGARREMLVAVGAFVLAAAAFLTGQLVVTPGEHAAEVTEQLVDRVTATDTTGALALFTPNAVINYGAKENPSSDLSEIRAALLTLERRNRISGNRITSLVYETLDEQTGEVRLRCTTSIDRFSASAPSAWILRVRRGENAWLIDRLTWVSVFGSRPSPRAWR